LAPPMSPLSAVHPRECGGNTRIRTVTAARTGPSPRVRGKRFHRVPVNRPRRSIPASAGETGSSGCSARAVRVHPRECGGNLSVYRALGLRPGPSPRVRGKHLLLRAVADHHGSIPASAGETLCPGASGSSRRVHPRECGGNGWIRTRAFLSAGPSPRVRGKRYVVRARGVEDRSIPASAGETVSLDLLDEREQVHPRECGGNPIQGRRSLAGMGPSPRVRGKPSLPPPARHGEGSIPASAGETGARGGSGRAPRVHPRECGGN